MSLPSRLLAPLASAVVGAVALGLLTLAPTPAAATAPVPDAASKSDGQTRSTTRFERSSYLCYGYDDCRDAGMSSAGYAGANDKMYWRMYSGHNCTNYAAYRMVRSGLPNQRPWSGGGNATYWGTSMPRITDDVPAVGAVAWWKANTGPAGSAGHVAYVEKVVSDDELIISQDSWAGDFSWAVITRSSGNWPSGFIHFNDIGLSNQTAPVVSGIAKVGAQLSATSGTWTPADVDVDYQWFADGVAIRQATGPTLALGRKRLGQVITVATTGAKVGFGSKTVTSPPTPAVQPGELHNTTSPVISGEVKVEHSITLDDGTWDPAPERLTTQWFADGTPIDGAQGSSLDLTPDLAGRIISATVTATRDGWAPVAVTAEATAAVAPGTIAVSRHPSVTGVAKPQQTLSLDIGAYRPSDTDVAIQWLRDEEPVLNATGPSYLVSALDLGARIAARVTVTRAGYDATVVTTPASAPVRAMPRLSVEREKLNHKVRLTVTVTSGYVADVPGTVVVRVAGGFRQEVILHHGVAHLAVTDLPTGKRAIRATYQGGPTLERVLRTGYVWMP